MNPHTPAFNLPNSFPQSSLLFSSKEGVDVNITKPNRKIELPDPIFNFDCIEMIKYKTKEYVFHDGYIVGFGWDSIEKHSNLLLGIDDNKEFLIDGYGFPLTEGYNNISPNGEYQFYTDEDCDGFEVNETRNIPLFPIIQFETSGQYHSLYSIPYIKSLRNNVVCWEYEVTNGEVYTSDYVEIIDDTTLYGQVRDEHIKTHYGILEKTTKKTNKTIFFKHILDRDQRENIGDSDGYVSVKKDKSLKNIPIYIRNKMKSVVQ